MEGPGCPHPACLSSQGEFFTASQGRAFKDTALQLRTHTWKKGLPKQNLLRPCGKQFFFLNSGLDLQDSFCDPQVGCAYSSKTLESELPTLRPASSPPRAGEKPTPFPSRKPKPNPYTRPSEVQGGGHQSWSGVTGLPPYLQSVLAKRRCPRAAPPSKATSTGPRRTDGRRLIQGRVQVLPLLITCCMTLDK